MSLSKLDGLFHQFVEGLVVLGLPGSGTLCLDLFRAALLAHLFFLWLLGWKVCSEFVELCFADFASAWHHGFDVGFEEVVGACLVMVVQGSEEGILVFLRQLRLITLGHESKDNLFHFFLGHFGLLGVLNLIPGIFFTLRVWHGGKAVDSSLNGFVRLIITKNLLHETKLSHLLYRGHAT